MARVVLDLSEDVQLARDLAAGGVFVPGCTEPILADIELVVRAGDQEVGVAARVVNDNNNGAGCELVACPPEVRERLAALGQTELDEEDENDAGIKKVARNIHERLRGLTLAQQIPAAQHGEVRERIVLERIYGKSAW